MSGKSCAAVDPIENEEDRKKVSMPLLLVQLIWAFTNPKYTTYIFVHGS